jgi:hypothetical protein
MGSKQYAPNAGIKFTMAFIDGYQSITESHVHTYGTGISNQVYADAVTLMTARMALMGAGVIPLSGRLSVLGNPRTYLLINTSDFQAMPAGPGTTTTNQPAPVIAAGGSNTQDNSADEANSSIHMFCYDSSFSKHARYYLAGVPDVMVRTNPQGPWVVGDPNWFTLFGQYAALLAAANNPIWGFMARTPVSTPNFGPVQATGISQSNVTGLISVTCPTITGVAVGSYVQLRGWGMTSRAYIPINGTFQVSAVTASTGGQTIYQLAGSATVAFAQIETWGTVQQIAYQWLAYAKCQVTKQGTHKRGKSLVGPRGSRRTPSRVSS